MQRNRAWAIQSAHRILRSRRAGLWLLALVETQLRKKVHKLYGDRGFGFSEESDLNIGGDEQGLMRSSPQAV